MMISQMKARVQFIFATIFLDALNIGLLIPVMPEVIRKFNSDPSFVNTYFGYFISVYALIQFFMSPVLGSLSDRFGRRPVLLLSLFGAGLDYLMMAFAPSLGILFLGRIISGATGASMTVASSYIADVSNEKNRAQNFGTIGAAFGLGFIVGPAIGGLLSNLGPQAPFIVAAAMNLLNFLFGLFVLPESLSKDQRREVQFSKLNPFKSLVKILWKKEIDILVWLYLFLYLAGQVHPSIWTLYTEHKFGWSPMDVGISLTAVGLMFGASQGLLTRLLIPKWGEAKAVTYGLFASIAGFLLYGLATEGWMIYIILFSALLSGITFPALQAMISKDVSSSEQGELQGSLISIASLTTIIGPLLYTRLFEYFTQSLPDGERPPYHPPAMFNDSLPSDVLYLPGAPYFGATLISLIALAIWFRHLSKRRY